MTETMTNKVVKEAEVVKTGESEYGTWILWNFKIHGSDKKFSYFEKDDIRPSSGMAIQVLKYTTDIKTKGEKQYTNYKVTEITVAKDQTTKTTGPPSTGFVGHAKPARDGREVTMYISYAKDLICQHMIDGDYDGVTINELAESAVRVGLKMYDLAHAEPVPEPKPEKTGDNMRDLDEQADYNDNQPPISSYESDDIPF